MDQDRFRQTYREMNERACLFEKSILSGRCSCSQSSRFCLAEREGVHCVSDQAQDQCGDLLELLKHHARFALKLNDASTASRRVLKKRAAQSHLSMRIRSPPTG